MEDKAQSGAGRPGYINALTISPITADLEVIAKELEEVKQKVNELIYLSNEREGRLERIEKVLFKNVEQFAHHTHDSLGRAVMPLAV